MADPELELKGGGGGGGCLVLIYLPCWPFSLPSFLLFLLKITGGPGPPLDPPLILIGNAAFYLPCSPANTIGIPVLCTDRYVLLAFLGDEYPQLQIGEFACINFMIQETTVFFYFILFLFSFA